MKKKRTAQSAFFNLRAVLTVLVCAAACSIVAGTLLAFLRSEAPSTASERTVTFAERIGYQRAIEDVYWRHRIWPKERPDSKPPLDAVMSRAQIESKVRDYLRNSQALEDYWQRPITAEQLQAEMDRMAQHTKQPEVLRELFEALGNDPFVIAECLVRPVLTEPLVLELSAQDNRARFEPVRSQELRSVSMATTVANGHYILPEISEGNPPCTDDTWTPTSVISAPDGREFHTALWTGSEMIVWGGGNTSGYLNTGGNTIPARTHGQLPAPPTRLPGAYLTPRFGLALR